MDSREILSLEEETDGCVNFESLSKEQASEELFSFLNQSKSEIENCGHKKLFFADNLISRNNSSSITRKIPKIIHMTAKTKCS